MKRLASLLLFAALPGAAQTLPPPVPQPPPGPDVMYICPGGTDFAAHFSKEGELATLKVPGQPDIELPRQNAGSGFAYSDSYYELRGRGREATLTAAGRAMRCHAAGRPGEPARTFEGPGLVITLFGDGTFRLRERRDGLEQLDVGQWAQEVDGGVRLVLRGGLTGRRAFREVGVGKLVAENGTELARAPAPDPIDGKFRLAGLYRDAQDGGLFAECLTGRTYAVAPGGAEPDLERAWVEATPSRDSSIYMEIDGRFADRGVQVERLVGLKPGITCPPLAARGAALRGTEWRLVELDGQRPTFDDWRRRPTLRLDDEGRFFASTGCTNLEGEYMLDPEGLRFVAGPTTLAACPPPSDSIERQFVDSLNSARAAYITSTMLDLSDGNGKRRVRLEARGR